MADLVEQKATATPLLTDFTMSTKKKELLSDAMKRTSEWYAFFLVSLVVRDNAIEFIEIKKILMILEYNLEFVQDLFARDSKRCHGSCWGSFVFTAQGEVQPLLFTFQVKIYVFPSIYNKMLIHYPN